MHSLKYLLYSSLILIFSSCRIERANRRVYAAQPANVAYFNQKGDAKLTGGYSGDDEEQNGGFNVQGAYAITNHLVVMASYTGKHEKQVYNYDSIRFASSFLTGHHIETNIYDSSLIK